jgi:hypothetical protein
MNYSRFLSALCIAVTCFAVNGCGSGGTGDGSVQATSDTPAPAMAAKNSFVLTQDTLRLKSANFMAATNENGVFTLRTAIAYSMNDPDFVDVIRIDLLKPEQIYAPRTYMVGENGNSTISPCDIIVFNGEKSTLLNTVGGTVSFSSFGMNTGDLVAGNFAVQVEDDGSALDVKPVHTISGTFSFVLNMPEAIL